MTKQTIGFFGDSFCATKQESKDKADADLMLFTKALMAAMYAKTTDLVEEME